MNELITVYDIHNVVVYEGTYEDCWTWMMQFADELSDGRKIYRTWSETDGTVFVDVGRVFYLKKGKNK